jgi:hypothetical protein
MSKIELLADARAEAANGGGNRRSINTIKINQKNQVLVIGSSNNVGQENTAAASIGLA